MISTYKRTSLFRALLCIFASLLSFQLSAQKMLLSPADDYKKPKRHPYISSLKGTQDQLSELRARGDYEKLIVILVDFQEETVDDPNTTGNGKFQLEPDPDYVYSIGAPPHDREYFEANLEAMKYYYLAVSAGSYNLQYDVWPKDKAAYTLPQSMGYYNPSGVSNPEFVTLMEEYFKDAFETADQDDPEINFADYAHYMIIHAGSDWQHDIFGDTPSDLPSFFIRVGAENKVVVDDGQTEIYHACNVPATISQDFEISAEDGYNIHSGYGALNSVLFHEFGHSLGLVDLYNVRNFYPMVGAFDIMDSGGAGVLLDELDNGDLVYVQGVLPSLPGAFSRALLFEDDFTSRGLMVDVSDLQPYSSIEIAASSMMQSATPQPTIIKFPISTDEYFLIENRSVDPDGDGATAVYGTLDGRVVLYPTAENDPTNSPTYEYDYLLPSFIGTDNSAVGGGILVWHVNDQVIYDQGSILEDGSFWSNFENNTINTNFNSPGVSVLEADGLRDLGEAYSMYWTGTPYEYFHAHKPVLDNNGAFVNWSTEPWRPRLSAGTKPAMLATNDLGSLYYLEDISSPAALMSFTLKSGFFEELYSDQLPGNVVAAPPMNTNYSDLSLPFYSVAGLNLFSYLSDEWQDLMGQIDLPDFHFDYPLITVDNNDDGYQELVAIKDNRLFFMDLANIEINSSLISFSEPVGQALAHDGNVIIHTASEIYRIRDYAIEEFASITGIRTLAFWEDHLLALRETDFLLLNPENLSIMDSVQLPERFGNYEPLLVSAYSIYLMSDAGNLYHYDQSKISKIFTNQSSFLPSQIGGFLADDSGVQIFFGMGNRAYLLGHNGHLKRGFPRYLDQVLVEPQKHPKALLIDDTYMMLFPVQAQGYLAIDDRGAMRAEYSLCYHTGIVPFNDYLHYDESASSLLWYHAHSNTSGSRIYIHSMFAESNPIIWNGYRNGVGGAVIVPDDLGESMPSPGSVRAYVFPNPAREGIFRLRITGAWPPTEVSIYDISGKRVFSQTLQTDVRIEDIELDGSHFSSGVYIAHIKSTNDSKTIKFAVEK
jgi:M6 family metalloprotease-like protein